MFQVNAQAFYDATTVFSRLRTLTVEDQVTPRTAPVDSAVKGVVMSHLHGLADACITLGAVLAKKSIDKLSYEISTPTFAWQDLVNRVTEIDERFRDEMEYARIFALDARNIVYYDDGVGRFSLDVMTSFPGTIDDLDEAGKCFALGRNTACVFHLMRALEHPLMALAKMLLPDDPRPNWDPIIKRIDDELKLPHNRRAIKGSVDFYAELSAHMHAVKIAWRNRVMHVDAIVAEDRAKAIFDAVIGLMNHVSKTISDDGETVAGRSGP